LGRLDSISAEKLARGGRFEEAENLLRTAAASRTDDDSKIALAAMLIAKRDFVGYQKFCKQLSQEFNPIYDPKSCALVLRICWLRADSGIPTEELELRLSAGEPIKGVNGGSWFEVARGLHQLRIKRTGEAIESLLSVFKEEEGRSDFCVQRDSHGRIGHGIQLLS
jgi:thioredoxin-like negative regulator of GroEL